jgi:hypothetical protein
VITLEKKSSGMEFVQSQTFGSLQSRANPAGRGFVIAHHLLLIGAFRQRGISHHGCSGNLLKSVVNLPDARQKMLLLFGFWQGHELEVQHPSAIAQQDESFSLEVVGLGRITILSDEIGALAVFGVAEVDDFHVSGRIVECSHRFSLLQ